MKYIDKDGNLFEIQQSVLGWCTHVTGEVQYYQDHRDILSTLSKTKQGAIKKLKAYAKTHKLEKIQ